MPISELLRHLTPITQKAGSLTNCYYSTYKRTLIGKRHYIAHDGQLLIDPDDTTCEKDRRKKSILENGKSEKRKWNDPPEYLSDHAPVNYATHLENLILKQQKNQKPDS